MPPVNGPTGRSYDGIMKIADGKASGPRAIGAAAHGRTVSMPWTIWSDDGTKRRSGAPADD